MTLEELERLAAPSDSFLGAKTNLVTSHPPLLDLKAKAIRHSFSSLPCLIQGETGTGKELVARILHGNRKGDFVAVNINAINENLWESELFGHLKGSFTGADKNKKGYLEQAENGTLFLDEIGDMKLHLQVKLLRVLEDRKARAVGSSVDYPFNTRIVAATNKPQLLTNGSFREDLYWRLAAVKFNLIPLRQRRGDIQAICNHLYGGPFDLSLLGMVIENWQSYDWPGNVRELKQAVDFIKFEESYKEIL